MIATTVLVKLPMGSDKLNSPLRYSPVLAEATWRLFTSFSAGQRP